MTTPTTLPSVENPTLAAAYRVREIFFPYADEKTRELQAVPNARVAYYTTAETAFRILTNRQFWLRSTATMNDYSEVEHGFDCLREAYASDSGKVLQAALDSLFPGVFKKAAERFDSWLPSIRNDTYIACFSEHSATEDQHGRLSMWRAYGGTSGVALVLKADVLFAENDGINVFASPVAYWSQAQVEAELRRIAERINANHDFVRELGSSAVEGTLFSMFKFSVLCTKHPGFEEEREWRVIASPKMYDSPLLTASVEVVKGVPQLIQKVALQKYPDIGLNDLEPEALFDRVIIGPCDYPFVVRNALDRLLVQCGIAEGGARAFVSQIPLRMPSA